MGFSLFLSLAKRSVLRRFLEVPFHVVFQVRVSSAPPPLGLTPGPWIKPPARGHRGTQVAEEKGSYWDRPAAGEGGRRQAIAREGAGGGSGKRGRTGVCRPVKRIGRARVLLRREALSRT